MTTQSIALFKALGAKMEYLSQRQRVLAQNIANSDTPGYKPQDLKPVDFGAVLQKVNSDKSQVRLETTNSGHMPNPDEVAKGEASKQKKVYEVAPAGNAVVLEEQVLNSSQTLGDYNLMTSLYEKNIHMIQIALGTRQ